MPAQKHIHKNMLTVALAVYFIVVFRKSLNILSRCSSTHYVALIDPVVFKATPS